MVVQLQILQQAKTTTRPETLALICLTLLSFSVHLWRQVRTKLKTPQTLINQATTPQTTNKMTFNLKSIFAKAIAEFAAIEVKLKSAIAVALTIGNTLLKVANNKAVISIAELITPEIVGVVPNIVKYLTDAVLLLTTAENVTAVVPSPGQSDIAFLEEILSVVLKDLQSTNLFSRNAFIAKLTSILLSLIDGNTQPEHVYDTLVQNAVANSKLAE